MRLRIILPALLLVVFALGAMAFATGTVSADSLPFLGKFLGGGDGAQLDGSEGDTVPNEGNPFGDSGTEGDPSVPTEEEALSDGVTNPVDPASLGPTFTATDGYLIGNEYGLALVQTTRVPSPTHQGWVDMTLDLVATAYSGDEEFNPAAVLSEDGSQLCFTTAGGTADCFRVEWGSRFQFLAVFTPRPGDGGEWPGQKARPMAVTFEIPANATRASLVFNDQHVTLDLQGDQPLDLSAYAPSAAPYAELMDGNPEWSDGYWLSDEHGIAVTGVSRAPHASEPTWVTAHVDLLVTSFRESSAFDPAIDVEITPQATCFGAEGSEDCVRVFWGEIGQFDAILASKQPSGSWPWARLNGWPLRLSFSIPRNETKASLVFGNSSIAIDLRGQTGTVPPWEYRSHYDALPEGTVLYESEAQSITLSSIEHDPDTGNLTLVLHSTNHKENKDFFPEVVADVSRVSSAGVIYDGTQVPTRGWEPPAVTAIGTTRAPGQAGEFQLEVPRVVGTGFDAVSFTGAADTVPDAALVRVTAVNADPDIPVEERTSAVHEPLYVPFLRADSEERYWFPDLVVTDAVWDPAVPTAGDAISVRFTLKNRGPRPAEASTVAFAVDGVAIGTAGVAALAPGEETLVSFGWTSTVGKAVFTAVADSGSVVSESSEINNSSAFPFAGAALPDLVVGPVRFGATDLNGVAQVEATVTNAGKGRARSSRIAVYLNGAASILFFVSYPALEPGESATATFPLTSAPEPTFVRLVADGFADVVEADETNNERVVRHDGTLLSELVFWPGVNFSDTAGTLYELAISVTNTGLGAAPASLVHVFINGDTEPTAVLNVARLESAESASLKLTGHAPLGLLTFRMVLDATDVAAEGREDDNEITINLQNE